MAGKKSKGEGKVKRQLTVLLVWTSALMVLASLEAVILSGPKAFSAWQALYPHEGADLYTSLILTRFLTDILVPLTLSLYTYFTIQKLGTPPFYRLVWGTIVFLGLMWKALSLEWTSPFWYLSLLLWSGLLLTLINIHRLGREME